MFCAKGNEDLFFGGVCGGGVVIVNIQASTLNLSRKSMQPESQTVASRPWSESGESASDHGASC